MFCPVQTRLQYLFLLTSQQQIFYVNREAKLSIACYPRRLAIIEDVGGAIK